MFAKAKLLIVSTSAISAAAVCVAALVVAACIPLPIPVAPEKEEIKTALLSQDDLQAIESIKVAPYYHKDLSRSFGKDLLAADEAIVIVDPVEVWRVAFPEFDADRELNLKQLLSSSGRGRVKSAGVDFIVILRPLQSQTVEKSCGIYPCFSATGSTRFQTLLYDLSENGLPVSFSAEVSGKSKGGWIPISILLFTFPYTDPHTDEAAIRGVATGAADEIRRRSSAGGLARVLILAERSSNGSK